jgi:NADH dehydrogenase
MTIAVTGANSSVGQKLLAHVVASGGIDVIAGVRSERAADSLPSSPHITRRIISYDAGELAEAMRGASCVVHLAGILIESKTSNYADANVAATVSVVQASRTADVGHIVLISVLGASPNSANAFLRSKGDAERAVAQSGIPATIIRTPILLGPGTAGADALLRTARRGKASLLGGGGHALRPLDLDDLCRAILRVCETRPEGVSTHKLVGPEPISYRDLVIRVADLLGTAVSLRTTPVWLAKLGASVTSRMRGGGISPTVIDVITTSEEVQHNAADDLGVSLTPLSETLNKILSAETEST